MFNWILSLTIGAIVALPVAVYMVALGLSISSIVIICLLASGYTSAMVALLLDGDS